MNLEFRRATPHDLPALQHILRDLHLVLDGIEDHLELFWLAAEAETLVGAAGLEVYGTAALLRSVAVHERVRGIGLGAALVERCLRTARDLGISDVVLLTETAVTYFPRFGFQPIPRSAVPTAVRSSVEFRGSCPDSAAVMHLKLLEVAR